MSRLPTVPYETTLHVRDHCLCLHTQRAARALARLFDDALRPLALTNQQFSLLMSLNRPEPPSMGAVANLLAMDRTTLTAALKPLQRRGLLKLIVGKTDRRARFVALTPQGSATLSRAQPIWERTHAQIDSLMSKDSGDDLRSWLHAVSTRLGPGANDAGHGAQSGISGSTSRAR